MIQMTVTSFYFFVFLLAGVIIYYLAPKKIQWIILLCLSIIYYFLAAAPYTIIFLIISAALAYFSTNMLENKKVQEEENVKKRITYCTVAAVILNVLIWFILKGDSFWIPAVNFLHTRIPSLPEGRSLSMFAALGMGYYTAQIIGYILDCYWGICKPQKNFLKLFLFTCFFPQLTVGPISKYSELESLYEKHRFQYINIAHGTQRILWGLFKKLVISDRIAIIVNGIWSDTLIYHGVWPWVAVLLYPLEIYTDFSGCVDIVLGAAELFDIKLPENFRNPFFSRNCQEFWQRWHITLGVWAKDHVYYPVLRSRALLKLGKWAKERFEKKTAKLVPWTIGMGVLWFVMGFWHGTIGYIIGVSAYFWVILVVSQFCAPVFKRITAFLKVDTKSFSWHLFQSIRTYIIYAFGVIFFAANSLENAFEHVGVLVQSFSKWNPWTLSDGSVLKLGVTHNDLNVIIASSLVLLVVDVLREKYGSAREWVDRQNMIFRWILYGSLFFGVLIFGMYGPGYSASEFIYGQF